MSAHSIDTTDLVRIPWKSGAAGPDFLDCWHLMRAAFARAGKAIPADIVGEGEECPSGGRFVRIGETVWHASELLDVALTRAKDGGRHVATLVSLEPKRFLTTSERTGSRRIAAEHLEHTCLGVYRWVT